MKRTEKDTIINDLSEKFKTYEYIYITDTSKLTAESTTTLRRMCFAKGVKLRVAKNKLIRKAMEQNGNQFDTMFDSLKGTSAIMFSEVGNMPAKVIKEFRKAKKSDRPILKSAYIQTAIFVGDNQLESLVALKSKNELIGEIIGLLQSPMGNLMSALKSSGGTIAGLVKTLSERPE